MLFDWNVEITSTTEFLLQLQDSGTCLLNALVNRVRNDFRTSSVIAFLRLSHVKSVQDSFGFLGIFSFLSESVVKQNIASLCFNILDTVLSDVRHLDKVSIGSFSKRFNLLFFVSV